MRSTGVTNIVDCTATLQHTKPNNDGHGPIFDEERGRVAVNGSMVLIDFN